MNDRQLCKMFGTTLEEVEADVEKYERGDFSDFDFSKLIEGGPAANENPMGRQAMAEYRLKDGTVLTESDIEKMAEAC